MYKTVSVKRLRKGMHVSLRDIPWFKHPFLFSQFEIAKKSQIEDILATGYETVLYDPQKSKVEPLSVEMDVTVESSSKRFTSKNSLKNKRASELRKRRMQFAKIEKSFISGAKSASQIFEGVKRGELSSCDDASELAKSMSDMFDKDVQLAVHHINLTAGDPGQYYHSLNVMVLSLMLGKQLGLGEDAMNTLSLGALLHDVGQLVMPKKLLVKPKLSKSEMLALREHPKTGVAMLSKIVGIKPEVMKIVYQHHEECTGKGYPKGLSENEIFELSKIVALVDMYDRMVNARDQNLGLPPHKALSFLYTKKKESYDRNHIETFIKMLGVYPPGTVCRFSSGDIGIVVGMDPADPLRPEVIIYDPSIPKNDAIVYKLGQDIDLKIQQSLNSKEIDDEVKLYLDSRSRIQYFPSETD